MTPSEQEDLTLALIEVDCLRGNHNAIVCKNCGHVEHFPNNEVVKRCRFDVSTCEHCQEDRR
jgi:predicted nucleic-acid-binding Zn-ribbon protein